MKDMLIFKTKYTMQNETTIHSILIKYKQENKNKKKKKLFINYLLTKNVELFFFLIFIFRRESQIIG